MAWPDAPLADGAFPTPSGKCEFFSERVAALGQDGLPDHVPNHEAAGSSNDYPLAMISPPARNFLNSSFVNVQSLRDIEGQPLLEIHPDDASARGIRDGATVCVFNQRGRYHCIARISPRARAGVVQRETPARRRRRRRRARRVHGRACARAPVVAAQAARRFAAVQIGRRTSTSLARRERGNAGAKRKACVNSAEQRGSRRRDGTCTNERNSRAAQREGLPLPVAAAGTGSRGRGPSCRDSCLSGLRSRDVQFVR